MAAFRSSCTEICLNFHSHNLLERVRFREDCLVFAFILFLLLLWVVFCVMSFV